MIASKQPASERGNAALEYQQLRDLDRKDLVAVELAVVSKADTERSSAVH